MAYIKLKTPIIIAAIVLVLVACSLPANTSSQQTGTSPTDIIAPRETGSEHNLTDDQIATLTSLKKVDPHPLYTMNYQAGYEIYVTTQNHTPAVAIQDPVWACSLFAALNDPQNMLYGRNFDWQHSLALLLFSAPPDGFASVSLVDITYLGFSEYEVNDLIDLTIDERQPLLNAPQLPFDGMNEHGLVIGMAAVPPGNMQVDPAKMTIGSLGIIRLILDQAKDIKEATILIQDYNIDFEDGPPIHYLIADANGDSALVEFYRGNIEIFYNQKPWDQATNFLRASVQGTPEGQCWRYDRISHYMSMNNGKLDPDSAMSLLAEVSQANTQWSVVYAMQNKEIYLVMGQTYDNVHSFTLLTP